MKKNLFKKWVWVLGAILLLANTILPGMVAYAYDPEQTPEPEEFVAEVDGEGFESLQLAINSIIDEWTITLISDIELDNQLLISNGKTVTLDIWSYNIKAWNGANNNIVIKWKLILKWTTWRIYSENDYSHWTYDSTIISVEGWWKFIMESWNIYAVRSDPVNKGQFWVWVYWDWSSVVINWWKIEAWWYAITWNWSAGRWWTTVIINWWRLISTADYAIYNPQDWELIINDWAYVQWGAWAVAIFNWNMVVNGGTLISAWDWDTWEWSDWTTLRWNEPLVLWTNRNWYWNVSVQLKWWDIQAADDTPIINIDNSKYTISCEIMWWTYTSDPTAYLAEGYEVSLNDNKYVVSEKTTIAKIWDDKYYTLQSALDVGWNIVLQDNVNETVTVTKDTKLDLNGKKIGPDNIDSSLPTIKVNKNVNFAIENWTVENNSNGEHAACIYNNWNTTIENVKLVKENDSVYYVILNHGNMTINTGSIIENLTLKETAKQWASLVDNWYYNYSSTNEYLWYTDVAWLASPKLTINGWTFNWGLNTIKNDDNAQLEINAGLFQNNVQVAVMNWNIATINWWHFNVPSGNDKTTLFNGSYGAESVDKWQLTVNWWVFDGEYLIEWQNGRVNWSTITITQWEWKELKVKATKWLVNTEWRPDLKEVLKVSWWTFTVDPTEYVAGNEIMVGQSETEYIVWTTADLKDVESDANYIASPTTKVAFWSSSFDDTTLSIWSVEIEVAENTGSAINNNDKPDDWDMKVNEGNTPTVEWQVAITFPWHKNEVAKFKTPILIRIPIISNKLKARVMVKHAWSGFNYKGLTKDLESEITCDEDWDVPEENAYSWEEVDVVEGYALVRTCSASIFVAYTETAKVTPSSSSGRTSGGGSSTTTTKKDDKKDDTQVIELKWEVTEESATTWEVKEENTKSDVIISDAAKAAYNDEQLAAYQWAYENGITTINNADEARLWDPLTRAELAKMMSQYISSVLKKSPIKTDLPRYKDVDESLWDLADYIVKAYQYQIMGINADGSALENFNPNGLVTRAEYATVFSRVLYWDKNNQAWADYYSKHLAALKEAGILSNDNPTIQEVRGWVMLMMYRSANEKAPTQEEPKTEEWTGNNVWIANPASTYCIEQEWEIEIREETDGGQYGVCKFKDGTEVEEWEYFRANHKDETSTWVAAEATTWSTAETLTGSTTESN